MSFWGRVLLVVATAATCAVSLAQDANLQAIECPFPEGQEVVSEEECGKYSACEWTDGVCHVVDNAVGGYVVQGPPEVTTRGFKVNLKKADDTVTMFGDDVTNLVFEVIQHEDYHLQVKIYDADAERYEVPVPLSLPDAADAGALYTVSVSGEGEPFDFVVSRKSNNNIVFRSLGPLTFEDQFLQLHTSLASTYLYGFGENTHLSFRHTFEPRSTFPIFARDHPIATEPTNEYGHHPYYMVMEDDEGNSHSVLLYNSNAMEYSTFLLEDGTPALTLRTIGGIIDLHMFLGPLPEDLITQYTSMVGNPAFPPYWYLGFQLSRWGYNSTDYVRAVRERMKAMGIPQDIQTVDINYTDEKRDFTLDPINWSDFPELIQELHNDGLKLTLLVDPALVIDFDNYPPAARGKESDVFIKWSDPSLVPDDQEPGTDDYMVGYVWPANKTVFPDFLKPETQAWWINELKIFHELLDFDTLWIDMNEPANFGTNLDKPENWPPDQPDWSLKCPDNKWDSPPYPTVMTRTGENLSKRLSEHTLCMSAAQTDGNTTYMHYNVHSLYGWSETVATYRGLEEVFPDRRPVILSRSTFPGSGQYAFHWLGDNSADWTQMRMSVIGVLEFNMFGVPMVGADICGFFDEPDMELCARWMELGSFYPFSRNHNTNGTADQDPAMWPEVGEISRYTLNIRYQYLPYLYSLFHRAHMNGASVARPLLNVFPSDLAARDVDDQFMWGDGLMIAPVLTQGATSRDVYFPEGIWYDLVTGVATATGPTTLTVDAPLEVIPLYVPGGTILPYQVPALNTVESRQNPLGLTVALDGTLAASGEIFWDDGEGEHDMSLAYMSMLNYNQSELTMSIMHGEDMVTGLFIDTINIYGFPSAPQGVTVNDVALPAEDFEYTAASSVLTITTHAPLAQPLSVKIV
ncbi:sucrase-isomaltase, intestinal-like [Procambarus clarkii]|uniref:sucrase-isomaltase, intestinal-like n=1 Tax=Procambarus clarkii TaxID=6728 RepID=UPI003744A1F2